MKRGKFVTLEGCEGVGKSTQAALLKEYCAARGLSAAFTREPGGTAISERVRGILLDPGAAEMDGVTELLLYAAARRQHVAEFIEPNLAAGKTVFCDRFTDSTLAYQGFARGLSSEVIEYFGKLCLGDTLIDATVFLDLPPDKGFARKGGVGDDRLEREEAAFHSRVYAGYRYLAARERRFIVVDADADAEEVNHRIVAALTERGVFCDTPIL